MANLLELKKEFNMIPEYQIKNLTECTTDELLFELGYCDWLIKQEHDLEYAYQLKTLIVNNLLKIKVIIYYFTVKVPTGTFIFVH